MGRKALRSKQLYPQPVNANKAPERVIKLKFRPQPKTEAQRDYMDSLNEAKLTIGAGPAGSGKSFLAMSVA